MTIPSSTVLTDSTTTAGAIYIGTANSAEPSVSSAVWIIKRVTVNGDDVIVEWASGDATPNKIWANRASLTYK